MLLDKHMKKIVDYPGLFECFPGVEIKGGVSYFLWSREHTGECEVVTVRDGVASQAMTRALDEFDIFVRANAAIPVLRKVRAKSEPTLDQQAASRVPFGLQANFRRYELTPFAGSVKIYGNKFIGHTERSQITKNPRWVDEWKALLPKATDGHGRIPAIVTPQPVIAAPGEACTDTYLVIGHAASEEVIKNLSAYLCTKFARFLISLRKVTQDNKPATFAFVPDLPMDRAWTDAELYERYELTVDEVAYVESQIKSIAATTKADE
jgi:site-specific DNA-methyltransferase (adenine-specific)